MDFSLFAHMERVESTTSHAQLYQNLLELAVIADQGNMIRFWTGEHHGMEYTITPNPFLVLIDIARITKNLRLGTGTIIAPFWHPIKLAGEAALTDLITGGRLDLGVARGAYSFEYERLMPGMDAWQAGARMREMLPLLPKLWAGDCINKKGIFYPFAKTSACPKPLQEGGPPIWVAARDPSSHQFALHHKFNVQVTPLWKGTEEIEQLMKHYLEAAKTSRKQKIMLLQHIYLGKDSDDCAYGAEILSKFYCYFSAWFANKHPVSQGHITPLKAQEIADNKTMSAKNMMKNLLIGTKDQIIDRLKQYQDLGFDEFSLWLDNGLPSSHKRTMLTRFIDEVMPAFR